MNLQEMYKNKNVIINDMDCILVDYDLFFDEELGKYNYFSIDDENEIVIIKEICQTLIQLGAKIYVMAYNENENSKGEKYIYADSLWVDTKLSVHELYVLFEENKGIEPSDISSVNTTEEYNQKNLFLFETTGEIVDFKKIKDETDGINIKSLYWD